MVKLDAIMKGVVIEFKIMMGEFSRVIANFYSSSEILFS